MSQGEVGPFSQSSPVSFVTQQQQQPPQKRSLRASGRHEYHTHPPLSATESDHPAPHAKANEGMDVGSPAQVHSE